MTRKILTDLRVITFILWLFGFVSSFVIVGAMNILWAAGSLDVKWQFSSCGDIISTPAVDNTAVYLTCNSVFMSGDRLYAVDLQDGHMLWEREISVWALETVTSPAISSDGIVYIGGDNEHGLIAINAQDGRIKFEVPVTGIVRSSPAIGSDNTVYVGTSVLFDAGGLLYAISPEGALKWEVALGGSIKSSPTIGSDDTIYVGSTEGKLYAIDPHSGQEKWAVWLDLGGFVSADVISSPAIGVDGTLYVGSDDYHLYAVNTVDGSIKWSFKTGNVVRSSPAIAADGTVYVGSNDNKLYAIDPDSGQEKWAVSLDLGGYLFADVISSPAIGADGTIYVGSGDGYLYAVSPSGEILGYFQTGDSVHSSPIIGAEGTVYFGSEDNYLYAIDDGQMGPQDAPWPMFRHDARHTGSVSTDNGANSINNSAEGDIYATGK